MTHQRIATAARNVFLAMLMLVVVAASHAEAEAQGDKKVNKRIADALERIADAQETPIPITVECVAMGGEECPPLPTCDDLGCAADPPDLDLLCPAAGWVRPCPEGTSCQADAADPPTDPPGDTVPDEVAASALWLGDIKPTQTVRPRTGTAKKWVVYGPKTQSTGEPKGEGDTLAEALANYTQVTGQSIPPASPLSAAERQALSWYSSMDASGGPTALRRDQQGRWHAEWYRRSQGTPTHEGPFGTVLDAVAALQSGLP